MPDGTKIPIPPVLSKISVPAKDANFAGPVSPPNIFHVRVIDAVAEFTQELDITDALVAEMGRVVVKAEPAMIFHGFYRSAGRGNIKGNLGRVHFKREVHIKFVERVKDWHESFAKVVKPLLD